MGSAFGAGAGADALQEILARKFREALGLREIANREQQTAQQGVRDQASLKHYGAMEEEAKAQTDMQRKRLEAELNRQPPPPAPARPIALGGRLVTPEGKVLYEPPPAAPEGPMPVMSFVNGKLVKVGDAPKGARIVNMPKSGGGGEAGGGPAPAQAQQNEVEDAIKLIQQIRDDKARALSTGPIEGRGFGAVEDLAGYTRFGNLHNNLVGKLALAQAGKLKGQGQISDKERALLMQASTALTRTLSDEDYLNELAKVEAQFQRMLPGPRATAAPAPVAAPAQGASVKETPEQRLKRLLGGG